jgi:integrase
MAQPKIKVGVSNGSLRLVFQLKGQRYYLYLGLLDNATNRRLAELKAAEIEKDILLERFDGIDKYRHSPSIINREVPVKKTKIDLKCLWEKFVDHQRKARSPSTMKVYRSYTNSIERIPESIGLDTPALLKDWILDNHAHNSGRRLMVALNACCKWGLDRGELLSNPLAGWTIKAEPKGDYDIDSFTAEERDRLLATIKEHPYWCYYYRLIGFLFFTGCRPSEAIALTWGDITNSGQSLTFRSAAVFGEDGRLEIKAGLKQKTSRTIKINEQVRFFISAMPEGHCKADLVFPSPSGKIVNTRNLAKRTWFPALESASIERKKLYQTRHTFITLALAAGISPQDVARYVGNSTKIIYENYASNSRELEIPEL